MAIPIPGQSLYDVVQDFITRKDQRELSSNTRNALNLGLQTAGAPTNVQDFLGQVDTSVPIDLNTVAGGLFGMLGQQQAGRARDIANETNAENLGELIAGNDRADATRAQLPGIGEALAQDPLVNDIKPVEAQLLLSGDPTLIQSGLNSRIPQEQISRQVRDQRGTQALAAADQLGLQDNAAVHQQDLAQLQSGLSLNNAQTLQSDQVNQLGNAGAAVAEQLGLPSEFGAGTSILGIPQAMLPDPLAVQTNNQQVTMAQQPQVLDGVSVPNSEALGSEQAAALQNFIGTPLFQNQFAQGMQDTAAQNAMLRQEIQQELQAEEQRRELIRQQRQRDVQSAINSATGLAPYQF